MLQYVCCMAVLVTEMLICSIIICPMPAKWRRSILESIARAWNHYPRIRFSVKAILVAITGLTADAVWGIYRAYKVTDLPHEAESVGGPGRTVTMRLFEAERNLVMGLFILFLFMLIYRFQSMVHQAVLLANDLELNTEKLQAQDLEYKRLLKERELYTDQPLEVGESNM